MLVGGSYLLRGGLRRMLEEIGADIVGDHASAEEVTCRGADSAPVVYLLMASSAPRGIRHDIAVLRSMDPGARIAVMRAGLATHELMETFTAGGDGFILEEISAQALHDSLGLIALGEKVFPSQLATLISGNGRGDQTMLRGNILTGRERQIILCLTQGKANKEIAIELNLALATVKVHVKSLLRKLGLHNRTQAAIWALDTGLVEPPSVTVKVNDRPRPARLEAPLEDDLDRRTHLKRGAELTKLLVSTAVDARSPAPLPWSRVQNNLPFGSAAINLPPDEPE